MSKQRLPYTSWPRAVACFKHLMASYGAPTLSTTLENATQLHKVSILERSKHNFSIPPLRVSLKQSTSPSPASCCTAYGALNSGTTWPHMVLLLLQALYGWIAACGAPTSRTIWQQCCMWCSSFKSYLAALLHVVLLLQTQDDSITAYGAPTSSTLWLHCCK